MSNPLPSAARAAAFALLVAACSQVPTGPGETVALPPERLAAAGARASAQIQRNSELLRDLETVRYARCVADALIRAIPESPNAWEVVLLRDETPDAYALAGRRLGLTKGLLRIANNQDRLAAVLAHGIGHVLLGHTDAHIAPAVATEFDSGGPLSPAAIAAIGGGAQAGSPFAYTADEEAAADARALALMGAAGFDPAAAAPVWAQLQAFRVREGTSGERPPPMLLVHPTDRSRLQGLRTLPPAALTAFDTARLRNQRPACGTAEESEH